MTPASSTAPCRYMQEDLGLTPLTEGLVTSSLLFGAAFGALFGGRLADRNGRRKMIMVLAVIFLVGTLACTVRPEHRSHDPGPLRPGPRRRRRVRHRARLPRRGLAERPARPDRHPERADDRHRPAAGLHLQRLPRQHLRRIRRDLALDARHRHPAGDRTLDRDELHARKPALAGLDGQLRRDPQRAATDPLPVRGPGRVRGSQGHGRGGLQVQNGLLAGPRCALAAPHLRGGHRPGRHPADHAA